MSQQKQAPLPRQEFQEWLENAAVPVLVLQKGKHLGSVGSAADLLQKVFFEVPERILAKAAIF